MSNSTFRFPNVCTFTAAVAGANLLSGTAQLTVTSIAGGNNLVYNPGTSVTAGSFVTGVTYQITSLGTTNWQTAGAPANATVGTKFTAIAAGSGTGTAVVAVDSCLLNVPGLPADCYIASQASGTAGGNGVYNLACVSTPNIPIVPATANCTQGANFTSATSAATSLPVAVDGPIQSVVIHQNSNDTGSVANNYVQGSVDGGITWTNLSSGLALTTAAPANAYQSSTSGNQIAMNLFRLLVGTVTGTANVGGAIRSIYQNKN